MPRPRSFAEARWLLVLALITLPASATDAFPDDEWSAVLEAHVDDAGLVDYAALAANREALDRVVAHIEAVSPRSHPERFATPDDELAYLINAYNALVFAQVLTLDPRVDSVWGKSGTGIRFFVRRKVVVGGETISLKKLEDDWIRAPFGDPRIHAALNCASRGCPRLPREPFRAATLDAQLDAAMREFVADPRHVAVETDPRGTTVYVSKIFDWFEKDFVGFEAERGIAEPSILTYINPYRPAGATLPTDARMRFAPYDKGLNRQP